MFILSVQAIVPIGLRNHSRSIAMPGKRFGEPGKFGFVSLQRGKEGKFNTVAYPDTKDKHDFYFTYLEGQGTKPTQLTSEPLRRRWREDLKGLIPCAIRYRWNRDEERIDSAILVTPDGKSKFEINEKGLPVSIYFKPNYPSEQELIEGLPLIVKASIKSKQIGIMIQDEKGDVTPHIVIHPEGFGITGHFTPKENKWSLSISDPRLKLDLFVLGKQLQLFLTHYNDKQARFEIISRYKAAGKFSIN